MNRQSKVSKVEVEVDTKVNNLDEVERLADSLSQIPPQVVIKGCRDCDIHINPEQTVYIPMKYAFKEQDDE